MNLAARVVSGGAFLLAVSSGSALAQRAPPGRAEVTAVLLEAGPSVPHCGVMHFIVPMRYRVVAVRSGPLAPSDLEVAVSCPELHRVRFVPGERHRLTLVDRRPWRTGGLVPWPGHPTPSRLWWAMSIAR